MNLYDTPGVAIGKTTAEMKLEGTFIDWDFEDVWDILAEDVLIKNIYLAHNGQRRIKFDNFYKVIYTNSEPLLLVGTSIEGTYFEEDGVLYFQLYKEETEEYMSWMAIENDNIYLPPILP